MCDTGGPDPSIDPPQVLEKVGGSGGEGGGRGEREREGEGGVKGHKDIKMLLRVKNDVHKR